MKKYTFLILVHLLFTTPSFCQQIPDDIKATLEKLKAETRTSLDDIRTNRQTYGLRINLIQWIIPEEQFKKAEKLNLKLHLGMIYDNDMRNRILQLLKNEYRPDELDTLTNRWIAMSSDGYERKVVEICKFDTMKLFKHTLDSFYVEEVRMHPKDHLYPYHYNYNVFKIMRLNTLTIFKNRLDSILKEAKKEATYEYLKNDHSSLSGIAELCGYINDKRFIPPLIAALDKPDNFQKKSVIEALARMKVEPYHSNLLKENTHTMEEVLAGVNIDYTIFTDVLRSQESFLELSKYLKSNIPCFHTSEESEEELKRHGGELKFCILQTIYNNLENEDMKTIVGNGADKIYIPYDITPELDAAVGKLYDWMQKNYGKYKIGWYHY